MTSRGTRYWDSGAVPLIAPDILGDIISTLADLAIVISGSGEVLSVLANPAALQWPGFVLVTIIVIAAAVWRIWLVQGF